MRWLEPSQDAVEEALRQALDAAQARTGDEIARRRVWTRIAEPHRPFRGAPWLTRLAVLGTLGAAAAGGVLVWPASTGHEQPIDAVAAAPPLLAPVARSEAREPQALPRAPLIEGPRVLRPKARRSVRLVGSNAQVDLEANSILSVDRRQRASIERGRVSLAVPHQPEGRHFSIGAGPCVISVLGTKFHVRVAGKNVGVDVDEGVVEVWSEGRKYTVGPGHSWTSPVSSVRGWRHLAVRETATPKGPTPTLRPSPPPVMPDSGPFREVQAALAEGHPQRALEILEVASRGEGPEAENAAYEVGWLLRDRLVRPRQALAAWDRYRARFPRGLLRAETDLSVLETMLMLGDATGALAEAKAFLDRHPASERRAEITRVVRALRGEPTETPPPQQAPEDPGSR
jgi:hypothetical protein